MKTEWISVKDRLPEFEQKVLLFDHWHTHWMPLPEKQERKDIRVGYLSEVTTRNSQQGIVKDCEWKGTEFAFNITHWMPLPEPPQP